MTRCKCPECGKPTIENDRADFHYDYESMLCDSCHAEQFGEWSGSPDPNDPDNYWIDDKTGERVNAHTGERSKP